MTESIESLKLKKAQRDLLIEGFLNLIIIFVSFFFKNNVYAVGNLGQIVFVLCITLIPAILLLIVGLFSNNANLNKILVGIGIFIILFNLFLSLLLPLSGHLTAS
ncbi:MAG: hypothetical protein ACFFD5_00540 [Candidatus Thorarchaeota archaeon]